MTVKRFNNAFGTTTDSPLSSTATTMNSAELPRLGVVDSANNEIARLTLDPERNDGAPEIVHVTDYDGSATSATIERGKEGTTAREHASGTTWEHAPTVEDFGVWLDPIASGNAPGNDDDDEFDNGVIDTTAVLAGGSATWTERHDVLSAVVNNQTSSALAAQVAPLTSPSTGLIVEAAVRAGLSTGSDGDYLVAGLILTDGDATTDNVVLAGLRLEGSGNVHLRLGSGALDSLALDSQAQFRPVFAGWAFLRLMWSAADTFDAEMSFDGATWTDLGLSSISQTMTPTHVGVAAQAFGAYDGFAAFEYLRRSSQ